MYQIYISKCFVLLDFDTGHFFCVFLNEKFRERNVYVQMNGFHNNKEIHFTNFLCRTYDLRRLIIKKSIVW